jgi:glycosyltransferase involved in cell wall biosynthesis
MKILYSHRTKSADGQYVHIRALTDALAARGHDIIMAGPAAASRSRVHSPTDKTGYGRRRPDDMEAGAPRPLDAAAGAGGIRRLLPGAVGELAELAYSARGYQRLAAKAAGADILYERYNLFYHAGVRLARRWNLPFLLEVNAPLAEERARHGGLALRSLANWSERTIWRAADRVLPVTGVLAATIEAAGIARDRIAVIHNGVGKEFLRDIDPRPVRARYGLGGKIVLGFTGFVRDWHRVDRAVHYLDRNRRSDLHLLVVGDGDARAGLEKLATELGVRERMTITGVVQREDIPAHVAAFDIALQPAVTDYASPLKIFEYMALARAIAAPACDNIREVLTSGDDALLFAPDDDAAFAEALDRLVGDAALRRTLAAAARASLVRRDLTWAGNAARIENLAHAVIEEKK